MLPNTLDKVSQTSPRRHSLRSCGSLYPWHFPDRMRRTSVLFLRMTLPANALPPTPQAWWLNRRERELCVTRYEINRKNYDLREKFSWHQVKLAALDWKTWSHSVNQFCVDVTLYVSRRAYRRGPSVTREPAEDQES
jgi:hypothetical protein